MTVGTPERKRLTVGVAYETLAVFVVRRRWWVVAFWIVVAILCNGAFPTLASQVNDNNSAFLSSSEPSSKAANLAAPLLGANADAKVEEIQVIATAPRRLTSADLDAIGRLGLAISAQPDVQSAKLLGISPDGMAAEAQVQVGIGPSDIGDFSAVLNRISGAFGQVNAPAGLTFNLAGQVATAIANQHSTSSSGNDVQDFSLLFVIVLLLIVFRSVPAAIVTLLPSAIALSISTRLIGGLGKAGLQISSLTEVLLIILLIGAGTDYGLFLVFRVREELQNGLEPDDAVRRAVVSVGESITGSAGTVIVALLTLLLASFGIYHDLGAPLAVGVAVMLALGLTLLPALLAILGRRAFWPRIPKPGKQKQGVWAKLAAGLVKHPGATLAAGIIIFLALAIGALGYKASGFGGATTAPAGSSAAAGNAAINRHFPQSSTNPANLVFGYSSSVWADTARLSTAGAVLERSRRFTRLAGPLDPNGTPLTSVQLSTLHRQLGPPQKLAPIEPTSVTVPQQLYEAYLADARFISADGRVTQFEAELAAGGQQSTQASNATPDIRAVVAAAAHASGASQSGVAGEAAAVYDINHTANGDLKTVVPAAIIAIGLLLALVLRSAVAPLYLIVSVALSYFASLGVAVIVFMDLGGQSGISFILPFLMFIFLLALGEDYNILVMTRIREEARQFPLGLAVVRALSRTGATITSAGIILGGTFAVFAIVGGGGAQGAQLRAIGFGLAFGILLDTFVVRTLLVPSTVMLLGKWNWFPATHPHRPTGLGGSDREGSASVAPRHDLQDPASPW